MRFYTKQHQFYCGIDLHARTMYLCIFNQDGEIVLHRNMRAAPEPFLQADCALSRGSRRLRRMHLHLVLARRPVHPGGDSLRLGPCPLHESHPWGQGQERYGSTPTRLPCGSAAACSPGLCLSRRDARDPGPAAAPDALMRQRAELLAHVQNTNSQYNLPAIGKTLAYKAQSGWGRGAVCRSRGAQEYRSRPRAD